MIGVAAVFRCYDGVVAPVFPMSSIIWSRTAFRWPFCLWYVLANAIANQVFVWDCIVDVVIALPCIQPFLRSHIGMPAAIRSVPSLISGWAS